MKAQRKDTSGSNDGLFVNAAKILSVKDISNTTIVAKNPGKQDLHIVLGLEVVFDVGKTFNPQLRIFGDLKYNPTNGEATGWGSSFKIEQLLVITDNEGADLVRLTPEEEANVPAGVKARVGNNAFYKIPLTALDNMPGKEVLLLSYAAGKRNDDPSKTSYNRWDILWQVPVKIEDLDKSVAAMKTSFIKSFKKSGYPKDFTGLNSNGTVPDPAQAYSEASPGEATKDDDLPF
jgi:hypothetical protein